jgi:pyruvate dehydrogenase E2 component (dihydrolipoamide acetyltransferase)
MQITGVRSKEVFMPALSSTMTSGVIVTWLKQPGDRVEVGDMIMTVESDKADMDVESFEAGYLALVLVDEGGSADVGATVALITDTEEDMAKVIEQGLPSGSAPAAAVAASAAPLPVAAAAAPAPDASVTVAKPDCIDIWMPALSSTMESGKIDEYYIEVGDKVSAGDIIMSVESDKASMDVESFDAGILAHISVGVGEECKVGDPVAFLAKTEADVPAVKAWAESLSTSTVVPTAVDNPSAAAFTAPTAPAAASATVPAALSAPVVNTGRIVASPLAKKNAAMLGVDLSRVPGTGPNGRIVAADVELASKSGGAETSAASSAAPAKRTDGKIISTPDAKKIAKKEKIDLSTVTGTGNFGRITAEDVLRAAGKAPAAEAAAAAPAPAVASPVVAVAPTTIKAAKAASDPIPEGAVTMTAMQKAVVQNMSASLDVPVFRVAYSIKTTAFDELYAKLKPKGVTVSALLAKAVGLTLAKHPIMNAAYANESITYRSQINVAMAVSLPDGGLMTPVLKSCDTTDLYSLSREWKELVKKTMDKVLKPDEYNSGTFFISNLGMFGVNVFDAILPPGAPSILAIGASKPVVALQSNGLVGVHKEMTVNITCDHRHIYGAQAAAFLKDLCDLIENDVTQLLM